MNVASSVAGVLDDHAIFKAKCIERMSETSTFPGCSAPRVSTVRPPAAGPGDRLDPAASEDHRPVHRGGAPLRPRPRRDLGDFTPNFATRSRQKEDFQNGKTQCLYGNQLE